MSYNSKVYRKQGGDELVIASGGKLTLESGSSFTLASDLELASGSRVTYAAGAYFSLPVQTLTTTQTATNITNFGLTRLNGSTTGPTYTLAAPAIAGMVKYLHLNAASSGATHRAVVNSNTTGVSFDTTGGNQITLATSALRGCTLVSYSTAAWKIVGVQSGASIAAPRTT